MLEAGPAARNIPNFHPDQRVSLTVEQFLKQRVICLNGSWVTRHQIIKYVANVAGGVHAGAAAEPEEKLIARMRTAAKIRLDGGTVIIEQNIDALSEQLQPLVYDREHLDIVLIELLTTARLVTEATDTIRLEGAIAT